VSAHRITVTRSNDVSSLCAGMTSQTPADDVTQGSAVRLLAPVLLLLLLLERDNSGDGFKAQSRRVRDWVAEACG